MKIAMMLCLLVLTTETCWGAFDDYQRFRKGVFDFEFETSYFKSDANYSSSGGSFQRLLYGQAYEIYNFDLKTRWDMSKRSAFYGSLDIANATSTGVTLNRTNSSITGAVAGFAYKPYSESFDLITDLYSVIPFNKIDPNTDTVINSEGVIEVTGLLRAQMDFTTMSAFGYIGATFRQSRSSLLPWGLGVQAAYPRWEIGGKIFGYQSITDDPDSGEPNRTQRVLVVDRVDGTSLKYYSVNPSVIDSEAYMKLKFLNAWTLAFGGGTTLTGANMAAGYHAGVSIKYSWDTEPSYYMKQPGVSTQEDNLSSEKKVPKFKEEINDGVDQKLFQPPAPPPRKVPQPKPSTDINAAPDNVAMKKVGPQPTPVEESSNNGGEVQIKLKKRKKKKSS